MGFLDHRGETQYPYHRQDVYNAILWAVKNIKGMKVENADPVSSRILVKAGVSLMSWGEVIPIQLSEDRPGTTVVSVTSTPKTARSRR